MIYFVYLLFIYCFVVGHKWFIFKNGTAWWWKAVMHLFLKKNNKKNTTTHSTQGTLNSREGRWIFINVCILKYLLPVLYQILLLYTWKLELPFVCILQLCVWLCVADVRMKLSKSTDVVIRATVCFWVFCHHLV